MQDDLTFVCLQQIKGIDNVQVNKLWTLKTEDLKNRTEVTKQGQQRGERRNQYEGPRDSGGRFDKLGDGTPKELTFNITISYIK